ncbi:autotransporter outer membrane beta-barrel domain-containing protein [Alcaligenes phenolicus]|uniref:autotransporter outer membrane beta-barrel domain-containing protein n=1 Tax=Alcaligenes phenolicus TaxID=232846 RepID=UPI00352E9669
MSAILKTLFSAGVLLAASASAHAYQTEIIYNKKGEAAFELRVFGPQDGPYGNIGPSAFDVDENGRRKIRAALERWAEILILPPNYRPGVVHLGTFAAPGASASSDPWLMAGDPVAVSMLQAALFNALSPEDYDSPHGIINIGLMPFDTAPVNPSQLPLTGQADYNGVIFHELAHALGLGNVVADRNGPGTGTPQFAPFLNRWAAGLRDDNGNPARPEQNILCTPCSNPYEAQAFDLRKDQGYFTGQHVQEVLGDAMPGVPVSILTFHDNPAAGIDTDYMSHSELRNSLMSHQRYRNYTNFMEAEIAVMQDLGLQIDRRNFYGYSVYGDDVTLVNQNGFFARNAEGTAYLPGQYNTATQGLGLHIYGQRNTITQAADLLGAGPGGIGVRVDGSENTLIIPASTRIHAQGWVGRGLQFSYGRNHTIVQQGEVRAQGEDGVAALFDFGNNARGNQDGYHGSWQWFSPLENKPLGYVPEILQGALIKDYHLAGLLSGKKAAIQISRNAQVENINIMQGARIQGDILSDYSTRQSNGELFVTHVNFGQKADEQGRATLEADPDFRLRYDGNIQGADNLAVVIAGGESSLSGQHQLLGLRVDAGATLSGNSSYAINPEGNFSNHGTLSPGNSFGQMTIQGDFVQAPEGRVLIEADTRQNDRIEVQGLAQLAGELKLQLQPDWYADGWSLSQNTVFQATQTQGSFDLLTASLNSPSLSVHVNNGGWSVSRQAAAYSPYTANPNAAAVGRSLEQASTDNQRPLASVYQALDFSAADGSEIGDALNQLSAGAYGAQLAASLRREQLVSEQLRQRTGLGKDGWQTFIQPFGGRYHWQLSSNDVDHRSQTYGVVFGAEHRAAGSDWSLGAHATANEQSLNIDAPYQAKSTLTGLGAGVHALYRADAREGWQGLAQVRMGLEQGKLNRRIAFSDYQANPKSDWTGHTFSAGLQTAYSWPLGEAGSIGPVLALDYLRYSRPGLREEGDAGSRLQLDSTRAHSLQASLGLAVSQVWELKQGRRLQAGVSASWEQALLGRKQTQYAQFEASPQTGFDGRYARVDSHALALRAGLTLQSSERLRLGVSAGTRLLGNSRADISGNVSLNWTF